MVEEIDFISHDQKNAFQKVKEHVYKWSFGCVPQKIILLILYTQNAISTQIHNLIRLVITFVFVVFCILGRFVNGCLSSLSLSGI